MSYPESPAAREGGAGATATLAGEFAGAATGADAQPAATSARISRPPTHENRTIEPDDADVP